jgi:F-type H+-transporting ATPase subunit a
VESTPTPGRKVYRYAFLVVLVMSFLGAAYVAAPLRPHIQLPAEVVWPITENFSLTNTMVATLIADVILILLALSIRRASRGGSLVLTGVVDAVSAILEALYSLTESTAGKWVKRIFPFFATIFLLVLVSNWLELIPGVDSIGWFEPHHVYDPSHCEFPELLPGVHSVAGDSECASAVVPWVRVASTDLNFTIALALVSVVMTQVIGVRALGAGYFMKFWNTRPLARSARQARFGNPMDFMLGLIDFAVGFLEIIAEMAKIISFSFRLFGNIFAGSVLLFVIGSLVPVFAQSLFLLLELFVGLIQALVFGMLTMVFMSQATQGHGDHGDDH